MSKNNSLFEKNKVFGIIVGVLLVGGYLMKNTDLFGGTEKKESKVFSKTNSEDDDIIDDLDIDGNKQEEVSDPGDAEGISDLTVRDDVRSEGLSQVDGELLEQPAPLAKNEVILFKNSFIVSYNIETKCPNYVAWRLSKKRLRGNATRLDEFIGDDVIAEPSRVETSDYYGSGYDRGHMCPAGDNRNDQSAMNQSFLMTNICPQDHDFNSGDWNDLEQMCRQWTKDYGNLYIVCGPIFESKSPKTFGRRKNIKVSVPDKFFKVVLMLGKQPKAIGFIYPNKNTGKDIRSYCVSVDRVERITGIDFYPNLPDNIEKKVEAECNPAQWGI